MSEEDPQKQATGNRQQATGNRSDRLRIGANIAQRLIRLATGVLKVARVLPKDVAGRHVAKQMIRAATSSGANYEEARAAESASDFSHKVGVALKELRETIFWLEIVQQAPLSRFGVDHLIDEAIELCAILGSSIRTARQRDSGL